MLKTYACFMLMIFLFSYLSPKEDYRKYFDFFIGIMMAAALLHPVLEFISEDSGKELLLALEQIEDKLDDIEYQEKGEDIIERFLREAAQNEED